ncbi:MAG: nicotinate (nicotinamide) nucleotide adenylyltransferase [Clostridia bacterium]|nr:nicotinate (nicotinamide) nucleotide adenylyltransferase [Clostridia bacterium]
MRIGIFGGSFDPVHKEHVQFVRAAIDCLRLDKVFVMPAHNPPHKPYRVLAPDTDRLETCRLAFSCLPEVEISDYEILQGGTSYTYLTCQHFRGLFPDAEIFFLVGTDMLRNFPTWRQPQSIVNDVTLAVCGRCDEDGWWEHEQQAFVEKFSKPFVRVDYNGEDVSSTKIRVLAGAGMRLTDFLDEKTAAYIEEKGLYKIKNADKALALEKPERQAHSIRVANLAAARALQLKIPEKQAIAAALFHDCAKNLYPDSPYLQGFVPPGEWGDIPKTVWHQFAGAYLAEHEFGVQDEDILNAIRYHTSARPNMSELEKLIFLADMLEEERNYQGVDILRELFWQEEGLDACLERALYETLLFLQEKQADIYPLTLNAYHFYKTKE